MPRALLSRDTSPYTEEGPIMANYGENTKKMIRPEERRWIEGAYSRAAK
ncbi:hypothetical protein BN1708_009602 [Verticillium longisporum]|uniref:Uncharacterized protein n=1 Tax=Verticillium longisporum TaxID=100787 RepID=A0A0G4KJS2_VERLO|nr:hypothetical protein BN1708_009602 [Verticillium longisporum]